ncbi:hypothetical protein MKZ38_005547 [Zalerion maritima]|uniref:Uncharacterized protein n=1 Tax=Zalerion maritima TaxID=339359 RepID=A0AAD5WNY0_9PEZI|nr:hypothetical protein MKZ38_005547 [Zalerion maritima]
MHSLNMLSLLPALLGFSPMLVLAQFDPPSSAYTSGSTATSATSVESPTDDVMNTDIGDDHTDARLECWGEVPAAGPQSILLKAKEEIPKIDRDVVVESQSCETIFEGCEEGVGRGSVQICNLNLGFGRTVTLRNPQEDDGYIDIIKDLEDVEDKCPVWDGMVTADVWHEISQNYKLQVGDFGKPEDCDVGDGK